MCMLGEKEERKRGRKKDSPTLAQNTLQHLDPRAKAPKNRELKPKELDLKPKEFRAKAEGLVL